jgi:hypothetical protein
VRAKSGYRRVYVSDRLGRIYAEWVWQVSEIAAEADHDLCDDGYVFVNVARRPYCSPARPETVYDRVRWLKPRLGAALASAVDAALAAAHARHHAAAQRHRAVCGDAPRARSGATGEPANVTRRPTSTFGG